MNKTNFSLPILVTVALLAGCTAKAPVATVAPEPTQLQSNKEMITTSQRISQAMLNNVSMKCEIKKKDGSDVITYEIKGKKTKASGASLSGNKGIGYVLNDGGEYMYIWNSLEKKGVKMSLKTTDPSASPMAGQKYDDFSNENTQKAYEDQGYTYDCEEVSLADSVFVAPADVTFTDLSKMMDSMKQMQVSPRGSSIPSEADQKKMIEDIKKMYGTQ
jgi:hypothetical protein